MKKKIAIIWGTAFAVSAIAVIATAQHRFRYHDEIEARPLRLVPATVDPGTSRSTIKESKSKLRLSANGIPDHLVGQFPNRGNPHQISKQKVKLSIPTTPTSAGAVTRLHMGWNFGVSLNGVVFDPLAAEFWQGNPQSGWSYNTLGGAIALGLDANYAHVQPNGKYHYHGIPSGLVELLDWSPTRHSPLIGYAADGFPIYAMTGVVNGQVTELTSSYRLKSGSRPGGNAPTGRYDGTFNEDYSYVQGHGTLDHCNGAFTVSTEYPDGTYAYFLTKDYPVVPRCFTGTPDPSFRFGRR
ncbi:YHYH protein [Rhodobacteraceae bacterium B1Z28]|uniref:YHYH protein n=1 Tax=Ruegeria haliotis TaxID=2747601 RepID=A0ABX2PLK5_9RHOB|nr:YHYH protein [Ruegeria haliotis]NVO54351.1 YHYH protein [Ruegeria haliotis]